MLTLPAVRERLNGLGAEPVSSTPQDFEKFATISQARRTELERGGDGERSLLAYLDLPRETSDRGPGGEALELARGAGTRTWHGHEFRCDECRVPISH